jgi:hypothetical protein
MACHEVAALRLGLMNVLGIKDEAERQHELAEIGDAINHPGPIRSLCEARDLTELKRLFEVALSDLEQRVTRFRADDPDLPYHRSLLILCKKVEMDLHNFLHNMTTLFRNLDEMHDLVHEIYPAK